MASSVEALAEAFEGTLRELRILRRHLKGASKASSTGARGGCRVCHVHLSQLRGPRWRLDGFCFYLSKRRVCFLDLKKQEKLETQIRASTEIASNVCLRGFKPAIIWSSLCIDHIRLESLAGDANFLDFDWHRRRACMNCISVPYGCAATRRYV